MTPSLNERLYSVLVDTNMVTTADEIDSFLCGRPAAAASAADTHALLSLHQHRREFSTCWLAFLRRPHTATMNKRVLLTLDRNIIPHLLNPSLLIDFLTDSYNLGTMHAHAPCHVVVASSRPARGVP